MHHMDIKKTLRKKDRWELHKNVTNYIEQILEAEPHKIAVVWPLTTHLNKPFKYDRQDM